MSKYFFFLLLLLGITGKANAQDMMLNGSFEDCDGIAPPGSDPYSIEYGAYWHNLTGTSDLINPCVPDEVSGTPCFGAGCGRFGLNATGYVEYLYGTTLPLTAGQVYEVSFWIRKDYPTETIRKVGLAITETVPTPAITNTTPLIQEDISSTQCVKLKACFTAQSSVTHYVTIGPFGGGGSPEPILYLVDSVSVKTIPPGTPLPESHVTTSKPLYCMGDQILLDGSASVNETSHQWKIYLNGTQQIYNSGIITGTVGTFNATNHLIFPQPGTCYRAELTTYGVCKDVSTVEFCFAEINLDFISDGNPVCENLPVDLQVAGDNGWIYTWNTGQSGVGLKTVTVTPTIGNATYSVTVTTPEGCTRTRSITLNVNSQNNIAPWMDGINGTGEYTYYVSQGDAVFFNSLLSNDHLNENMIFSNSTTVPSGYIATQPSPQGGIFSFSWVTSLNTAVGEYHYYLTADDKNACNAGIDTFDFRIIVICDQCLVCVSFEDRTPGGTPLPPETKAGKCIRVGWDAPVSTGDANVRFIAGKSIDYGNFWDAGPGYEGIIDPTTCVTDCEDCCTDWDGFRFDNNYYTYINKLDNDPTNDYFEITDIDHPFCSYGAKRFSLYILDSDTQLEYYHLEGGGYECCMLQTRTPENPIPHSSIFWDGYYGGNPAAYQYYKVVLKLYDCNDVPHEFYFMINVTFLTDQMMPQNDSNLEGQMETQMLNSHTGSGNSATDSRPVNDVELGIYPNPATNMLYISGSRAGTTTIQLYDEKGRVLTKREKVALNQGYSLESFSTGTYYCRIYKDDGTYVLKQFIKL
ncbi:hypothetical protein D3C87_95530 [compost metagenome]